MSQIQTPSLDERMLGGLWGSLVGDALGVPVEFKSRFAVQENPVTDMCGFGTHDQPAGTWSDDSSLLLCTADSLLSNEFDTEDMGRRFVQWMNHGLWTAHGDVFDMGMATTEALMRIANGVTAEQAGGQSETSNGNGSLMRILPIALRCSRQPTTALLESLSRASAITHGHARSKMACGFFGLLIKNLLKGSSCDCAFKEARKEFLEVHSANDEISHFRKLLEGDLRAQPEGIIVSTGYVIHTLTASLWCLLTTHSFEECVLKAVNLGGDTDTTGCVAGGLAGVHYGVKSIPEKWKRTLARHDDVDALFEKFVQTAVL